MKCNKCNHVIPEESEYCPFCGSPVEKEDRCPECGQVLPDDSLFCPFCGNKVRSANQVLETGSSQERKKNAPKKKAHRNRKSLRITVTAFASMSIIVGGYFALNSFLSDKALPAEENAEAFTVGAVFDEDIVEIWPKEIISRTDDSKSESFVICRCSNQAGDRFWIIISLSKYKTIPDSEYPLENLVYGTVPTTHILGRTINTSSFLQGLEETYGEEIILINKVE